MTGFPEERPEVAFIPTARKDAREADALRGRNGALRLYPYPCVRSRRRLRQPRLTAGPLPGGIRMYGVRPSVCTLTDLPVSSALREGRKD